MIEAVWWKEYDRVTVTGHARSAEPGKDLVCAGASTLAVTLGENVRFLRDRGYVQECSVRLEPGDAEIRCRPQGKYRGVVKLVFRSVCAGFEILARQYPEYILYTVRG